MTPEQIARFLQQISWSGSGPRATTIALLLTTGLLFWTLPRMGLAQGKKLVVHPKSQVWIHGDATAHDFTCHSDRVNGRARLPSTKDTIPTSAEESSRTKVIVSVPVQAFDCGRGQLTSTLKETLEAEDHPKIRFEVREATLKAPLDSLEQWYRVDVRGALTIAGTERLLQFDSVGRALSDNRFRLKGCYPIRMTYFNIDPPSKAFGLIQVKNRVQVQFDLLAHTRSLPMDTPFASLTIDDSESCSGSEI